MKKILLILIACLSATYGQIFTNVDSLGFLSSGGKETVASCWGWAADGSEYAAVAHTDSGTVIIDITDPTTPTQIGHILSEAGSAKMYHVKYYSGTGGNSGYLYTIAQPGPLQIIDVSDPANAVKVGTFSSGFSEAYDLYLYELRKILILTDQKNSSAPTTLYSLADPESPSELGTIPFAFHHIYCRNDTLWGFKAITYVYDISDPTDPTLIHSQDLGVGSPDRNDHSGWLDDTGTYLITDHEYPPNGTYRIWDVTDLPSDMTMVGEVQSSDGNTGFATPHNSRWYGHLAYCGHWQDGLRIFDLSTPGSPSEVGIFDLIDPNPETTPFEGAWAVYPWYPSHNIVISWVKSGTYVADFTNDGASIVHNEIDTVSAGAGSAAGSFSLTSGTVDVSASYMYWRLDGDNVWNEESITFSDPDYSYTLPIPSTGTSFHYYLDVIDNSGRVTRSPGQAPHDLWHTVIISGTSPPPPPPSEDKRVLIVDITDLPPADEVPPDSATTFTVASANPEEMSTTVNGWPADGVDWIIKYRTDATYPTSQTDGTTWVSGNEATRSAANKTASISAGEKKVVLFQNDSLGNWQSTAQANKRTVTVASTGGGGGVTPIFATSFETFGTEDTADVYVAGSDSTGTLNSGVGVDASRQTHGAQSLVVGPGDYVEYDLASDNLLVSEGSVTFQLYWNNTPPTNKLLFYSASSGTPDLRILTHASNSGEVTARWRDGTNDVIISTSSANITAATWDSLTVHWDAANDSFGLNVAGKDIIWATSTMESWSLSAQDMQIGNFGVPLATADTLWMDDFRIYDNSHPGSGGGGAPSPPNSPSSFIATATSAGHVRLQGGGGDDSLQVWGRQAFYPSRTQGTLFLAVNTISFDDTLEVDPGGVWYFSAFNDSAGTWSSASQDTASIVELDPRTPGIVASFVEGPGEDDSVAVDITNGGATVYVINGFTLFSTANVTHSQTVHFDGNGEETFIARRDSIGESVTFQVQASDTASFPVEGGGGAYDTLTTIAGRPRLFKTASQLSDFESYISSHSSEQTRFSDFVSDCNTGVGSETTEDRDLLIADTYNLTFAAYFRSQGMFDGYSWGQSASGFTDAAIAHAYELAQRVTSGEEGENRVYVNLQGSDGGCINMALQMVFDWLNSSLSQAQRDTLASALVRLLNDAKALDKGPVVGNGFGEQMAHLGAITTHDDNSISSTWRTPLQGIKDRISGVVLRRMLKFNDKILRGGAFHPEGSNYNSTAYGSIIPWVFTAAGAATGHNFFEDFAWLRDWPLYVSFYIMPGDVPVLGSNMNYFERHGDVDCTPADGETYARVIRMIAGEISDSYPQLAGYYKWLLESSNIHFSGDAFLSSDSRYYLIWDLLAQWEDITATAPSSAGIKKAYHFGHAVHMSSDLPGTNTEASSVIFYVPKWQIPLHTNLYSTDLVAFTRGGWLIMDSGNAKSGCDIRKHGNSNVRITHSGLSVYNPPYSSIDASLSSNSDELKDAAFTESGQNRRGELLAFKLVEDESYIVSYDNSIGVDEASSLIRSMVYFPGGDNSREYVSVYDYVSGASDDPEVNFHTAHQPTLSGGWTSTGTYTYSADPGDGTVFEIDNTLFGADAGGFLELLSPTSNISYFSAGHDDSLWYRAEDGSQFPDEPVGSWSNSTKYFASSYYQSIRYTAGGTTHFNWVLQMGASSDSKDSDINEINGFNFDGVEISDEFVAMYSIPTVRDTGNYTISVSGSPEVIHAVVNVEAGTYHLYDDGVEFDTYVAKNDTLSDFHVLQFKRNGGGTFSFGKN